MRRIDFGSVLRVVCLAVTAALLIISFSGCTMILESLSLDDLTSVIGNGGSNDWWNTNKDIDIDIDDDNDDIGDETLFTKAKEYSGDLYCYYYEQLSVAQQRLYNGLLLKAIEENKDYVMIKTTLGDAESNAAAQALLYDRRDLYEYGGWGCTSYGGTRYVAISKYDYWEYNSSSASQKESFRSAVQTIERYANENCVTDYEKALYVHDYIVRNCEYHTQAADAVTRNPSNYPSRYDRIFTAYGCLVDKKAVCAGYASAYKYVLDCLGINCVYVTGESKDVGHAWNRITLDGKKYYIDITWDDLDAQDYPKAVNYQYFDITTDELLKDHTIDNDFPHPFCNDTEHNYFYHSGYVIEEYDFETFMDVVNAQKDKGTVNIKFENPSEVADAEHDFIDRDGYKAFYWLGNNFSYIFDDENGYVLILFE